MEGKGEKSPPRNYYYHISHQTGITNDNTKGKAGESTYIEKRVSV